MTSCGRVAPEAVPCSVIRSGLIRGGALNSGVLPVLLLAVAPFSSLEFLLSLYSRCEVVGHQVAAGRWDER